MTPMTHGALPPSLLLALSAPATHPMATTADLDDRRARIGVPRVQRTDAVGGYHPIEAGGQVVGVCIGHKQ